MAIVASDNTSTIESLTELGGDGESFGRPGQPHLFAMSDGALLAIVFDHPAYGDYVVMLKPANGSWTIVAHLSTNGYGVGGDVWTQSGDTLYGASDIHTTQYQLTLFKVAYAMGRSW